MIANHTSRIDGSEQPRRSSFSVPLGLVTAGILGLVLQVSIPSCSLDLGSNLDANQGCGAQMAQSLHQDADKASRVLASAACRNGR